MWVKLADSSYLNLDNEKRLCVEREGTQGSYRVVVKRPDVRNVFAVVATGYATEEDAQAALDELADGFDAMRVQPPVTEEEAAEDIDDEDAEDAEDVDDEEDEDEN